MSEVQHVISQMDEEELAAEIRKWVMPYAPDVSTSRCVHLLTRAAELLEQYRILARAQYRK